MIDNRTLINFKKIILTFEDSELRVVAPIDLLEGHRYVKQVNSERQGDYLDQIYNITSTRDDYVNTMTDINLSWRSVSYCTLDSGEALEKKQK